MFLQKTKKTHQGYLVEKKSALAIRYYDSVASDLDLHYLLRSIIKIIMIRKIWHFWVDCLQSSHGIHTPKFP